jgi:hypothetical protein
VTLNTITITLINHINNSGIVLGGATGRDDIKGKIHYMKK